MDIDKLIAEIREHDARATPGPWHPQRGAILVDLPGPIQYTWALAAYPKDVALIAHYRTAAPLLAAEVERLKAERVELLAPIEGVDLEEVLRLDNEATQEPWRSYNAAPFKESIPLLTTDEIRRPMVRYETDEQLIVCYRTAAPILAREVMRLRVAWTDCNDLSAHRAGEIDTLKAALHRADEQGAQAIDRVSKAIVADKWNSTAELQEEVKRLTADLIVARRLLPPRYIAANGSIMDPERCTPHAPDCAECGRGRAHDEACLGLAETPAEQVRRLTAGRLAAPEDRHCPSDIYDCAACGKALSYAVDPEGEALDGCGELVCLECVLAYMVDMATGELRRAPALLEAKDAEIGRLTAERDAIAQALDDDCAPDIDGDRIKTLADRIDALLGRWQDEIRGALCARVPDPHRIDGGGCDSGDPLDLTLAEIAQAVNQLTDQADEQIAALTAERDTARRDAGERRLILGRISSWCHVMGRSLCPKAGSADTYGDGVRAMKAEIGAMLAADKATS